MTEIDAASRNLAIHFGEDPSKFRLSEFFALVSPLLDKIATAPKENEMRKQQEAKAKEREKAKERAQRAKLAATAQEDTTVPAASQENGVIDILLSSIRTGPAKWRKAIRNNRRNKKLTS